MSYRNPDITDPRSIVWDPFPGPSETDETLVQGRSVGTYKLPAKPTTPKPFHPYLLEPGGTPKLPIPTTTPRTPITTVVRVSSPPTGGTGWGALAGFALSVGLIALQYYAHQLRDQPTSADGHTAPLSREALEQQRQFLEILRLQYPDGNVPGWLKEALGMMQLLLGQLQTQEISATKGAHPPIVNSADPVAATNTPAASAAAPEDPRILYAQADSDLWRDALEPAETQDLHEMAMHLQAKLGPGVAIRDRIPDGLRLAKGIPAREVMQQMEDLARRAMAHAQPHDSFLEITVALHGNRITVTHNGDSEFGDANAFPLPPHSLDVDPRYFKLPYDPDRLEEQLQTLRTLTPASRMAAMAGLMEAADGIYRRVADALNQHITGEISYEDLMATVTQNEHWIRQVMDTLQNHEPLPLHEKTTSGYLASSIEQAISVITMIRWTPCNAIDSLSDLHETTTTPTIGGRVIEGVGARAELARIFINSLAAQARSASIEWNGDALNMTASRTRKAPGNIFGAMDLFEYLPWPLKPDNLVYHTLLSALGWQVEVAPGKKADLITILLGTTTEADRVKGASDAVLQKIGAGASYEDIQGTLDAQWKSLPSHKTRFELLAQIADNPALPGHPATLPLARDLMRRAQQLGPSLPHLMFVTGMEAAQLAPFFKTVASVGLSSPEASDPGKAQHTAGLIAIAARYDVNGNIRDLSHTMGTFPVGTRTLIWQTIISTASDLTLPAIIQLAEARDSDIKIEVSGHIPAGDTIPEDATTALTTWLETEFNPELRVIHEGFDIADDFPRWSDGLHDVRSNLKGTLNIKGMIEEGWLDRARTYCKISDPYNLSHLLEKIHSKLPHSVKLLAPGVENVHINPRGNARKFKDILDNLIRNASEHPRPGTDVVHILVIRNGNRLTITDDGSGMTPEVLQMARDGTRMHDGVEVTSGSHGFGLGSVRKNCDLFGIRLGIDSVWGQGSTFTLDLPDGFFYIEP